MNSNWLTVKTLVDYIENRVTEEISADCLAAAAGFSPQHFRAVFRDSTGQSLARYIRRRKLCHAAAELTRTRRPIAEIAMNYGFGSHDVFIRAFRREFGEAPSEFRNGGRRVSASPLGPGIYGPLVHTEEGAHMHGTGNAGDGLLYGVVPKVSYYGPAGELSPFFACLRSCLTYLGQEVSYARLMAGSGAAFRLMWNTRFWDGANVGILVMREDPTEPLRRALQSAGRDFRILAKPGREGYHLAERSQVDPQRITTGGKREFAELIRAEIDAGRPVIGFGIIGPPEPSIIAGYREGGEVLLGWSFFQEMPEFCAGVEYEPCGYFVRRGWFEHPETIAVMAIGPEIPGPTEHEFLRDVLAFGLSVMETPRAGDYAGGFAAFEAWAEALLRAEEFPKAAPLPLLMERAMCQGDAMAMIWDGRGAARNFFRQQAEFHPHAGDHLKNAAEAFQQELDLVEEMGNRLGGPGIGETHARNLAVPEIRHEIVRLIRRCRELDLKAADHMRKALRGLS